jgi:hypothetical protein
MTRTATTKLVATALAVASLGLASVAQADEGQGIAVGEPTPGQPVPAQTPDQANPPAQDDAAAAADEQAPPEKTQAQLDQERFDRFCNMKDAEPSHSDKKFCEDFRKTHGSGTTTENSHGPLPICQGGELTATEKELCHKDGSDSSTDSTGSYQETAPAYHKVEKADKGSLPFTGLEIWQLGLMGIVLVGGGFGARRLLAS